MQNSQQLSPDFKVLRLDYLFGLRLQEFALSQPGKCAESAASLARDTLGLLRRRPEPDVAASLLVEAGLLRRHEPLPLLRLGRSIADFDPSLIAAAEVGGPAVVGETAACTVHLFLI